MGARRLALLCSAAVFIAGPGCVMAADGGAAAQARAAADQLDAARSALEGADQASDRVEALTAAVTGYEAGMAALRASLRAVTLRESEMQAELDSQRDEIAGLLGTLESLSRAPEPVLMAHPAGPVGAARAGMMMAEATPALNRRAEALAGQLSELRELRTVQQGALGQMQEALGEVQKARTALSQAVADRTDLPQIFTADPMKTRLLVATTDTLRAFADGLDQIGEDNTSDGSAPVLPLIDARKGSLPWPAQGHILRHAGAADAAGVERPGVVLATAPKALVTTPTAATNRYLGPLLDYGNVMILEPETGILFVLAGMNVVYGEIGQVLPAGAPVGQMGGTPPDAGALLARADDDTEGGTGDAAGPFRAETLYIEVRKGNEPQDPETWFELMKDTQ